MASKAKIERDIREFLAAGPGPASNDTTEPAMFDRSEHPTVVEYGVQEMFKRKSPRAAAESTAKRLSGFENMFLGPGVAMIDPRKLEEALWTRLVDLVLSSMEKIKPGMGHFALDGVLDQFRQGKRVRSELKSRVIQRVGFDPFPNDTI